MTLPTTQNCDENGSGDSNNHCLSTTTNGVQLMDLMMTATPPDAPQCNGDQASRGGSDVNNNEIISVATPATEEVDVEGLGDACPIKSSVVAVVAPTVTAAANAFEDDDSDMFGPPRSAPLLNSNRPRVPMISAKLRLREERKRVLQLCANKLEKIKDSETNLRRSVCINNTYSRLTEEVRREKQSRYLANLPK